MVACSEHTNPFPSMQSFAGLKIVPRLISIVIPTMYRPKGLETAFLSAAAQRVEGYEIEIVIADNSPDASAKAQAEALFEKAGLKTVYISVPEPGIANVRNAALSVASGNFIAFLDDDQDATPNWLPSMIAQCKADNSCAVFAHIEGRSDIDIINKSSRLSFFSRRHDEKPSGPTTKFYGCGASLVDLSKIDPALIDFDPARNQTGGEDDAFFSAIQQAGGKFSWSAEALVYEDIPQNRMSKRYICQRSFAFGQGPSRLCLEPESFSLLGLVKWMMIGAVQLIIYAPLALLSWPLQNALHMKFLRKSCEGAGKLFWQSMFLQKLYGQAAVDKIKKTQKSG